MYINLLSISIVLFVLKFVFYIIVHLIKIFHYLKLILIVNTIDTHRVNKRFNLLDLFEDFVNNMHWIATI